MDSRAGIALEIVDDYIGAENVDLDMAHDAGGHRSADTGGMEQVR
jgi:hypothetical protein